jgi:hypothetical protein
MLSGKFVSRDYIMDRVFRLGLSAQFVDEEEVNEMIYDLLSLIAAPRIYLDKVAVIDIADGFGQLPCDFYNLYDGGVKHYGTGTVLTYSTDVYHRSISNLMPRSAEETFENIGANGYSSSGVHDNTINTQYSHSGYSGYSGVPLTFVESDQGIDEPTYKLERGYIFTGFATGQVEISYQAFPVDDKKLPMVPDNERVIRCVVYGLADRIGFRMMMADQLAPQKYEYLQREAMWYMPSAQNAARIPNQDQMETLSNIWLDPYRDSGHHMGGFKNLTHRTRMYTHNNRGRRR